MPMQRLEPSETIHLLPLFDAYTIGMPRDREQLLSLLQGLGLPSPGVDPPKGRLFGMPSRGRVGAGVGWSRVGTLVVARVLVADSHAPPPRIIHLSSGNLTLTGEQEGCHHIHEH
jgi:hypothetical protein